MCQGCEFEQNKFEDPEITLLKEQLSASRLAFVSVHEAYLAMQAENKRLRDGMTALIADGLKTTYDPHTVYVDDIGALLEGPVGGI